MTIQEARGKGERHVKEARGGRAKETGGPGGGMVVGSIDDPHEALG